MFFLGGGAKESIEKEQKRSLLGGEGYGGREENGKEAPMTEGREKVRLSAVAQICGAELNLGEQRFKMRNKEHMCHFSPFFSFLAANVLLLLCSHAAYFFSGPNVPRPLRCREAPDILAYVRRLQRRRRRRPAPSSFSAFASEQKEEKGGGAGFNKCLAVAKK